MFQFFKDFEIPTEYEYLWRYLENAYNTEGMHQSTPADREIIRHYEGKATGNTRKTHASLMKDARTFSVPSAAAAAGVLRNSNGTANGGAGDSARNSAASSEPEVSAPAAVEQEVEEVRQDTPEPEIEAASTAVEQHSDPEPSNEAPDSPSPQDENAAAPEVTTVGGEQTESASDPTEAAQNGD